MNSKGDGIRPPVVFPETFQEDCMLSFHRCLVTLIDLSRLNAPRVILASSLMQLWEYAEGAFGEELYAKVLETRTKERRQRMAWCEHCETEVPPETSFHTECEACKQRIAIEVAEMEKDMEIKP